MPPPRGSPNILEGPGDWTTTPTVHSASYPAIAPARSNLHGRAVFITGASRGLGRATALSFARAGASFIAAGARPSPELESLGGAVAAAAREAGRAEPVFLAVEVDVGDEAGVGAAAERIGRAFGRLDVVVGNAGVVERWAAVGEFEADAWWRHWVVSVRGTFLVTKAVLPLVLGSEGGLKTFVNVASVGAWLTWVGGSAYAAAKMALVRFTETLALEYREQGVIAFSVHPGNVVTTIMGPDGPPPETRHCFTETPELCADTLSFLTSRRPEWLSGRYITVIWDMPELIARKDEIVQGDKLKVKLDIL